MGTNRWTDGSAASRQGHWRMVALGMLVLIGVAVPALVQVQRAAAVPNTWSAAGSLATARGYHTATLLPNGKVLVAGGGSTVIGGSLASAELYDPAANTWSPRASASCTAA